MFLQGQCLVFASECMLVLVARRDQQHNLWEQGSLSAQDRQATSAVSCKHAQYFSKKCFVPMLFECSLNVVWMLSLETTFKQLWLRVANISKIVHKSFFLQMLCCLSVVWMLSLETTFRQLWAGVANISKIFKKKVSCKCCLNVVSGDNIQTTLAARCKHVQDFQTKCKCCLNVVSGDNIETTLRQHSGKRSVFRLFLAQNKCFRPLKKVKNTYFVRMLSLETTFRQHSLICCELQTCPVFLSTKCVLCQCCLNVVSRGGILDNIHNICLCYFLQKHVFKKF